MNARPSIRTWGAKANVVLIVAAVAAVLVVAALVTAVGFAIASAIVVGFATGATVLVPRMRVSAPRPAATTDRARRLLVVADAYSDEAALCHEIEAYAGDAVAVHLVVPVRVSHLHFLTNDEAEERREAEETMVITLGLLQRGAVAATGSVGSDKPLESMLDALAVFPAAEVVLALPPEDDAYWPERDLLAKARAVTERPVTQATVACAQPVPSPPREPARQQRASEPVERPQLPHISA